MRAINKNAKAVMDRLTALCTHIGDHDKFRTEPFMDVFVEYVDDCDGRPIFSIIHYHAQNGDLMRDPEMCFIKGGDGEYYPYYYRQDGLGIERECIQWDEKGNVQGIRKNEQSSLAVFAGMWMRNIQRQQDRVK